MPRYVIEGDEVIRHLAAVNSDPTRAVSRSNNSLRDLDRWTHTQRRDAYYAGISENKNSQGAQLMASLGVPEFSSYERGSGLKRKKRSPKHSEIADRIDKAEEGNKDPSSFGGLFDENIDTHEAQVPLNDGWSADGHSTTSFGRDSSQNPMQIETNETCKIPDSDTTKSSLSIRNSDHHDHATNELEEHQASESVVPDATEGWADNNNDETENAALWKDEPQSWPIGTWDAPDVGQMSDSHSEVGSQRSMSRCNSIASQPEEPQRLTNVCRTVSTSHSTPKKVITMRKVIGSLGYWAADTLIGPYSQGWSRPPGRAGSKSTSEKINRSGRSGDKLVMVRKRPKAKASKRETEALHLQPEPRNGRSTDLYLLKPPSKAESSHDVRKNEFVAPADRFIRKRHQSTPHGNEFSRHRRQPITRGQEVSLSRQEIDTHPVSVSDPGLGPMPSHAAQAASGKKSTLWHTLTTPIPISRALPLRYERANTGQVRHHGSGSRHGDIGKGTEKYYQYSREKSSVKPIIADDVAAETKNRSVFDDVKYPTSMGRSHSRRHKESSQPYLNESSNPHYAQGKETEQSYPASAPFSNDQNIFRTMWDETVQYRKTESQSSKMEGASFRKSSGGWTNVSNAAEDALAPPGPLPDQSRQKRVVSFQDSSHFTMDPQLLNVDQHKTRSFNRNGRLIEKNDRTVFDQQGHALMGHTVASKLTQLHSDRAANLVSATRVRGVNVSSSGSPSRIAKMATSHTGLPASDMSSTRENSKCESTKLADVKWTELIDCGRQRSQSIEDKYLRPLPGITEGGRTVEEIEVLQTHSPTPRPRRRHKSSVSDPFRTLHEQNATTSNNGVGEHQTRLTESADTRDASRVPLVQDALLDLPESIKPLPGDSRTSLSSSKRSRSGASDQLARSSSSNGTVGWSRSVSRTSTSRPTVSRHSSANRLYSASGTADRLSPEFSDNMPADIPEEDQSHGRRRIRLSHHSSMDGGMQSSRGHMRLPPHQYSRSTSASRTSDEIPQQQYQRKDRLRHNPYSYSDQMMGASYDSSGTYDLSTDTLSCHRSQRRHRSRDLSDRADHHLDMYPEGQRRQYTDSETSRGRRGNPSEPLYPTSSPTSRCSSRPDAAQRSLDMTNTNDSASNNTRTMLSVIVEEPSGNASHHYRYPSHGHIRPSRRGASANPYRSSANPNLRPPSVPDDIDDKWHAGHLPLRPLDSVSQVHLQGRVDGIMRYIKDQAKKKDRNSDEHDAGSSQDYDYDYDYDDYGCGSGYEYGYEYGYGSEEVQPASSLSQTRTSGSTSRTK